MRSATICILRSTTSSVSDPSVSLSPSSAGDGARHAQEILDRSGNLTPVGDPFGIKGSLADEQDADLWTLARAISASLPDCGPSPVLSALD